MTPRYARLYVTPLEIRKISTLAARRRLSVSDAIRAAIDLPPVYSRRAASSDVIGTSHHKTHRAIKVRIRSDKEAAALSSAAAEIDATNCDYIRIRLGFPRLRKRRG